MRRRRKTALAAAAVVVGAACGAADREGAAVTPHAAEGASVADTVRGTRFDAAAVRAGDCVGSLVVERIEAHRATADSIPLGSARFRGELEIGGRTMAHPGVTRRRC